jgi:hypothetical protein
MHYSRESATTGPNRRVPRRRLCGSSRSLPRPAAAVVCKARGYGPLEMSVVRLYNESAALESLSRCRCIREPPKNSMGRRIVSLPCSDSAHSFHGDLWFRLGRCGVDKSAAAPPSRDTDFRIHRMSAECEVMSALRRATLPTHWVGRPS